MVAEIIEQKTVHAFSAIESMHSLTPKDALVFLGKGFSIQDYILILGLLTQAAKRACLLI